MEAEVDAQKLNGRNGRSFLKILQRELIPQNPRSGSSGAPTGVAAQGIRACLFTKKRQAATALLACLSLWLGFYAIFGHDGLVAYRHKQQEARRLQQQIQNLQQENQRMALHDRRLQDDPDTIEYEAREHMHYTRPGEVIYKLPEAPGAPPNQAGDQPAAGAAR